MTGTLPRHLWSCLPNGRAAWLFTATLLLALHAGVVSAAANPDACRAALIKRGWQPLLMLPGAKATPAQGFAFIGKGLALQRKLLMQPLIGPRVARVRDELWSSLRDFDLQGLYRTLPEVDAPWRSLTVQGHASKTGYALNEAAADAVNASPSPFGALVSQLALRPMPAVSSGPSGDRYRLRGQLRTDAGPLHWHAMLGALRLGIRHVAQAAPMTPSRSALKQAIELGPQLPAVDQLIVAQLVEAYPAVSRWYAGIGSVAQLKFHAGVPPRGPQHVYLTLQLNDKALKARDPQVEDYLQRLGNFIAARFDVENNAGRWLNIHFDTQRQRAHIDFWELDGRLLPTSRGTPSSSQIGAPIPDTLSWRTRLALRIKALGLTVKLHAWPVHWRYHDNGHGMQVTGWIDQPPQSIDVTGRALGIVPAGLIENLSPVSITSVIDGFMQVLTHSNAGKGAMLRVELDQSQHGDSTVVMRADTELLDNFFVRLGVGMIAARVLPDADQATGIRRLLNNGLTAFASDLDRAQTLLAKPATSNGCD